MDGHKSAVGNKMTSGSPKALLSVSDGVLLLCGMVIGAGIFRAPSVVAANTSSSAEFVLAWVLGGIVSLCGALVYAELASRHPDTGGEYSFLSRGVGSGAAFVFAWSRMTVIQTGAIAAVAYVFGDYASEILRLPGASSTLYAALAVIVLTLINVLGTMPSKTLQVIMQWAVFAALILLGLAGLVWGGGETRTAAAAPAPGGAFGLAMIFVLLTYGGWNEAAYIAGEVRDARRNMVRILLFGIAAVTALYLLVNVAYLSALGLAGMRESKAVGADMMRALLGGKAAVTLALVVCAATLTTINAAIFTGARTNFALGRDFPMFSRLGVWRNMGSTPANALWLQGLIALVLVIASAATPDGFSAMVAYTAPVFWTFFFLTGLTLFVFRRRGAAPAFRVPLYPVVPLAFLAMCLYMLYSSVNYIRFAVDFGTAALAGIVIMALGIPLYFVARGRTVPAAR